MSTKSLSIITFNTLGVPFMTTHKKLNYLQISRNLAARFRYLAQELNTSEADVILLQEVHLYTLLRYLKRKLTEYPYCYYHRFLYGPKSGLVVFSKTPLALRPFFNFSVRGSLKNKSFVTRIIRNGALICDFLDRPLSIMNTYVTGDFTHTWGAENKYTPVQRSQLDELAIKTGELQAENRDVIIAGDLNIHANTALYTEFVSKLSLLDLFKDAVTHTHHADFLPKGSIAPRLDHIFMTKQYVNVNTITTEELFTDKVRLSNGKESYLSDHVALKASITIE